MNDALYEHLVARKPRFTDTLIRIGIIIFLILVVIIGMTHLGSFIILIVAVLGFLTHTFIFAKLNVEYEYTLLNHDIDIDAIYSKSKRKKQLSFDFQKAEIIAPKNSHRIRSYQPEKTYDFTSGLPDAKVYAIMINIEAKRACVLVEPDQGMLDFIKPWMGSKIHFD